MMNQSNQKFSFWRDVFLTSNTAYHLIVAALFAWGFVGEDDYMVHVSIFFLLYLHWIARAKQEGLEELIKSIHSLSVKQSDLLLKHDEILKTTADVLRHSNRLK